MFKRLKAIGFIVMMAVGIVTFSGCGKKENSSDALSFAELRSNALNAIQKKRHTAAIMHLEKLIMHYSDKPNTSQYKLLLADLYFQQARNAEAYELYTNFYEMYPSDKKAEYAMYQATRSKFAQTLNPDCDSSETEDTIKLCKNYYQNRHYSHYLRDVQDIEKACVKKLIDKEVYVFNFYLQQNKIKAAESRLKYLRENYLLKDVSLDAQVAYLEGKLAKHKNNIDMVEQRVAYLIAKHPQSPYAKMARGLMHQNVFDF